jgi:hypothetical protein
MIYIRPHVSTFYCDNNNVDLLNDKGGGGVMLSSVVQSSRPNYNTIPASLSFTGYAAKFINLSPNALNLYWDGSRKPDGTFHNGIHLLQNNDYGRRSQVGKWNSSSSTTWHQLVMVMQQMMTMVVV